jgi:dTDP-4-dehydrorhamnose reductase
MPTTSVSTAPGWRVRRTAEIPTEMRVVVSGASGRLGSAVLADVLGRPGWQAFPWTRASFDLDRPEAVGAALERDAPDVVVHCAAWTDVDGCAREPELAERRNGRAVGLLAQACATAGVDLVTVSTNEVFDGGRTDGRPYRPDDQTAPPNAYGRSKRLGEELALAAFEGRRARLAIVRTAWLFGPPGADFPTKILAAARQAAEAGRTLSLVADEIGSPSFAGDVAAGIVDLVAAAGSAGTYHVVNTGQASRAEWARRVLELAGVDVATEDVSADRWPRASTPPRWGVLEPSELPTLGRLRSWTEAVEADAAVRFATEVGGRST